MIFGIGIGDFIKVVELANKIVRKCKAATLEFRDLSRDVVGMQIVLGAIQTYWEQQNFRGRDLSDSQKDDLKELTKDCHEVLEEIEALLQRHDGLEAGTGFLNRMRWLRVSEIGPLRMRLLARTTYLSQFNSAIVAYNVEDPGLSAQARVLNMLNVINYRYHTGKRGPPAYTQATTAAELDKDVTWQEINDDLEKEGLDPQSIATEKPFIKKWIDDVILAEDNPQCGETSPDNESLYSTRMPPTSDGGLEQLSSHTESALTSPWRPKSPTRKDTDLTLVNRSPSFPYAEVNQIRTRDTRASISSTGRRKSSDHKPRDQQIQANLEILFRMDTGVSKDLKEKLFEHVFIQLDTTKRGIFPDHLETVLMPVILKTRPAAQQRALEIIEAETMAGSRMNQATFDSILSQILDHLNISENDLEPTKSTVGVDTGHDALHAVNSILHQWLLSYAEVKDVESLLPYGWEVEIVGVGTKFFNHVPYNISCHKTLLPTLPISAVCTFSNMLLLSRRCRSHLDKVQDLWESHGELDENYLKGSLELIEDVREAAHKFEIFSSRRITSSVKELDDMLGQADVIDMADVAAVGQLAGFPLQEVRDLQQHSFQSLQSIILFLVDHSNAETQNTLREVGKQDSSVLDWSGFEIQYSTEPPSPGQSRDKMENQARRILADATKWWESSPKTITACRAFATSTSELSDRAKESLGGSKRLYLQSKRCKHLILPRPFDLPQDKFLVLRLERAEDFPKGNKLFRAGPPDIEAVVFIDNIKLMKSKRAAVRSQTASGKDVYHWNVAEPYHISISAKSTLFVHVHNTKRRDRDDEGYMGHVSIDVSKLPTGQDTGTITKPLSNSYLKADVHPGTISMRVHWCPLSQFVRMHQSSLSASWARKDTVDDRFYFEDLRRVEQTAGSRTAIFDRRCDRLLG